MEEATGMNIYIASAQVYYKDMGKKKVRRPVKVGVRVTSPEEILAVKDELNERFTNGSEVEVYLITRDLDVQSCSRAQIDTDLVEPDSAVWNWWDAP